MRIRFIYILAATITIATFTGVVPAQELSTIVIPSEDELHQYLRLGELDYYQYLTLQEIAQQGIDSTSEYLLDEIPNLTYFRTQSDAMTVPLEDDQRIPFVADERGRSRWSGFVKYRYFQDLDNESRGRYRIAGDIGAGDKWSGEFKIHREYSGRERLTHRAAVYQAKSGLLRRLVIGSYTSRLGLGTVFGYRGKLLSYSGNLDNETLLFPDYGGSNGVYSQFRAGRYDIEALGSYNRDDNHTLMTLAGMVRQATGGHRIGLVFGFDRVEDRIQGGSYAHGKIGLYNDYRYTGGYNRAELTGQFGHGDQYAFVTEGRHRLESAEIKYAAWAYSDRFVDLSSGSKAASISRREKIDAAQFEYSGKRAGQEGLLVKTVVRPASQWEFVNSAIIASRNDDTVNIELLSAVRCQPAQGLSMQVDYLTRERKRTEPGDSNVDRDRRTRLEFRISAGKLAARSYIAYNVDQSDGDYLSLFGSVRFFVPGFGRMEIWTHPGRIRKGAVSYWYTYIRTEQELSRRVALSVKLSNAYRKDRTDRNEPIVSIELKAFL